MRFPSINQLIVSFEKVIVRFPIPIIYALIATIGGIFLSYDLESLASEKLAVKTVYLGNFGMVLSLTLCFYNETKIIRKSFFALGNLAILLVLLLIYAFVDTYKYRSDIVLLLILGFAFHLLVAFSAFHAKEENNGFWQINKTFFLRFATSALYSAVLFIGLSVALLSIQTLFDIKWDGRIYFRLWIIIAGLFNTIFFLAGIKTPIKSLNEEDTYPKGLKVFTQYVLIPLAVVYLAILLAYEIKIIFEWSLPQNSVAILILGYAVFGILSILLIHPLRHQEGNKWIQFFSRSFYLLMLPLLALLYISIIKRVGDYGITESRYLLIALAIWLTFITLYFLIRGREQIRIIPISLFVVAALIAFGPWGIQAASKKSQTHRLSNYLAQKSSVKRNNEVRDLVRYLYNNHGVNSLQSFVKTDLNELEDSFNTKVKNDELARWEMKGSIQDSILKLLKVSPNYEMESDFGVALNTVKDFKNQNEGDLDVMGAIKVMEFYSNMSSEDKKRTEFKLQNQKYDLSVDSMYQIHLKAPNKVELVFKTDSLLSSLQNNKSLKPNEDEVLHYNVPSQLMTITKEIDGFKVECRFESINGGVKQNSQTQTIYFSGYLIFYPKNKDEGFVPHP